MIEPAYLTASVATINADPYVGSCTFWDGVGKVQDGDQWILIDTQGNVVVDDPGFSGFYSCGNGLIAYQDAESTLWGYMTTDGKIAIEASIFLRRTPSFRQTEIRCRSSEIGCKFKFKI